MITSIISTRTYSGTIVVIVQFLTHLTVCLTRFTVSTTTAFRSDRQECKKLFIPYTPNYLNHFLGAYQMRPKIQIFG